MNKNCSKCGENKDLSMFGISNGKRRAECKRCRNEYRKMKSPRAPEPVSLDGEIWKEIPYYDGEYMVSNLGRIKSIGSVCNNPRWGGYEIKRTSKIIKPELSKSSIKDGYLNVILKREKKFHSVHQLVAAAFVPNPHNKPIVHHINHNKQDNRAENLMWATHKENTRYAIQHHGKWHLNGINHYKSKSVYKISSLGVVVEKFIKITDAAKSVNSARKTIKKACEQNGLFKGFYWSFDQTEQITVTRES